MSKPAHRGRVLVSTSRLEPLGHGNNQRGGGPQPPLTQISARRGSGSKSADVKKGSIMAAGTSALAGGMSKEKLQQRVNELEFEKQKLTNNLRKAEISIEGYKGFLSEKSASRAHSIGIQTDFLAEVSTSSDSNESMDVAKLTKMYQISQERIIQLKEELASLSEREKQIDFEKNNLQSQLASLKMTSELAEVSYKAHILTLEKEIIALKSELQAESSSPTVRTPTQAKQKSHAPFSLQGSTPLSSRKNDVTELSTAVLSSSKKLSKVPSSPPTSFDRLSANPSLDVIISPVPSMKKLKVLSSTKKKSASSHGSEKVSCQLSQPILSLKKGCHSHKSLFKTVKNAVAQDFDDFKEAFEECSHNIIKGIQRYESQTNANMKVHTNALSLLQSDLNEAKHREATNISSMESSAMLEKKFENDKFALEKEVSLAKGALEKEKDRADSINLLFQSKMIEKDSDISNLTTLFNSVSRELNNLNTKFKNETAAVKHIGHCRDLVRVATIRELSLEKDRAISELKYARDTQNVLGFCLETAEKALNEIQPHIVIKLHESRKKRTTLLEREVMMRRKDLDQRSAETCAVSSTHLEAFQEKATIKHKKAAEDTEALLNEIQNILNIKVGAK